MGLVSDSFHLTFGCGLLTFSLFTMAASRKKPDRIYTYGYKRLEVLAAFTNAYLSVSAVTNLLVNLIGAGLILASWFLTLGVKNAEVLCLGLVSSLVFIIVMPLFKATGGILLQMSPPSIPSSALTKCWRKITTLEDVSDISQCRFWELVPGHVVGSLSIQIKEGANALPILWHVHGLYHDLGVQELTVQTDFV